MNRRLLVIAAVLILCCVAQPFVVKGLTVKPSMLRKELPTSLLKWTGEDLSVTGEELKILARDTDFSRKLYKIIGDDSYPGVTASVVYSGKDINNSIHRPERCLRAQGWNFEKESYTKVKIMLKGEEVEIPLKEIVTTKAVYKNRGEDVKEEPLLNPDGIPVITRNIQYYTFFGHKDIVAGHYERTWHDSIEGRIIGGYSQRWAYATFSMNVTQAYVEQGMLAGNAYDDDEVRAELKEFIKEILQKSIK